MSFVHLHLHTQLMPRVAKTGMPACAITDRGNMFRAVHCTQPTGESKEANRGAFVCGSATRDCEGIQGRRHSGTRMEGTRSHRELAPPEARAKTRRSRLPHGNVCRLAAGEAEQAWKDEDSWAMVEWWSTNIVRRSLCSSPACGAFSASG